MTQYLKDREAYNNDPGHENYSIWGHNCGTLICDTLNGRTQYSVPSNPFGTPGYEFFLLNQTFTNTYTYTPPKGKQKACVEVHDGATGSNSKECN
jgi:hypothetical protein